MLHDKMLKALNEQINAEFWSAYLYLSMSSWFSEQNLPGFANWMYVQFQEEQTHAMKIFRYIIDRGGKVELKPIGKVKTLWDLPSDAFKETLSHEQSVTAMINALMDTAVFVKDYATQNFLRWFIDEQIEEEATANEILQTVVAIETMPGALRVYDKELGARTFVDTTGANSQ